MQIVVFTDGEPGWHGRRLRDAFCERGAKMRFLCLRSCSMALETGTGQLLLPGFERRLPDAAFVRAIPGKSLEEIVFHLDLLHALAALGVCVYNDGRAIERSVDKALTSFLLAQDGLPTPPSLITADRARAIAFVSEELAAGHRLVCKPLFGSQGTGIECLERPRELPDLESVNGVWYLQRFVPSARVGAMDWRLFVVGGQVMASVQRSSSGWLTNVACGGRCVAGVADGTARHMAERAARVLGMGYAGVDLIRDQDGAWWVLEVNSIPAWRGLQRACGVDVAGMLADDVLRRCCSGHRSLEAV